MILGIISDLHLEANKLEFEKLIDKINRQKHNMDYLIIAGDLHPYKDIRKMFIKELDIPVIFIPGNHDYYHGTISSDFYEKDDFVCATLWTNFWNNPIYELDCKKGISDFYVIHKDENTLIQPEDMKKMFNEHSDFIFNSSKEIVVTHFPPCLGSLSEKWQGHILNPYFVNNITDKMLDSNKKLWIHGHVHGRFDYQYGNCRVVCNPLGYPRENYDNVEEYQIKFVTLL